MEYSMDILKNHLAWLEERKHRFLDRGSCIKDVSEKILDLINTLNYLSKIKDDTMTITRKPPSPEPPPSRTIGSLPRNIFNLDFLKIIDDIEEKLKS